MSEGKIKASEEAAPTKPGPKWMTVADAIRLAREHLDQGRYNAAVEVASQVSESRKGHPDALHIMGVAAYRQGNLKKAVQFTEQAVRLAPRTAAFHSNLAEMYRLGGQRAKAAAAAQRAVELDSRNLLAWNNLGIIHFDLGRFREAEDCYRRVLQLDPAFSSAWSNLGNALHRQGRNQEAQEAYAKAIELNPNYSAAFVNSGLCYREANMLDRAEEQLKRAVVTDSNNINAHVTLSTVFFLRGAYADGWREYEYRLALPGVRPAGLRGQAWQGQKIDGQHLFIFGEQGLGDTIQFVRYLTEVEKHRPAKLSVLVQENLRPLLRLNFPNVEFVRRPPADADFHCALLSLHQVLGHDPADRTPAKAYLSVPDDRSAAWKSRFAVYPGLKVGLVWAGSSTHRNDHNRSLPAALLKPLFDAEGCQFFSLQIGSKAAELASLGYKLHDISQDVSTMSATAAAISALDLVITVDTSIAHLAGALGTEVWTMLSNVPDWRWGLSDSAPAPWYASMQLFRQRAPKDWEPVILDMKAALARRIA